MTSPIVSVEIGRSTWQGPAEEAPGGAGNRDADMGECFAFSAGYEAGERDGRPSGQQVRAVEMLGELLAYEEWQAHVGGVVPDRFLGVINRAIEAYRAALTPAPQPEGLAEPYATLLREVKARAALDKEQGLDQRMGLSVPQPEGLVRMEVERHLHDIINCGNCAGSRQSARLALRALKGRDDG